MTNKEALDWNRIVSGLFVSNEIRETKDIAKENGKKLDFLVDAYRKSLN